MAAGKKSGNPFGKGGALAKGDKATPPGKGKMAPPFGKGAKGKMAPPFGKKGK